MKNLKISTYYLHHQPNHQTENVISSTPSFIKCWALCPIHNSTLFLISIYNREQHINTSLLEV